MPELSDVPFFSKHSVEDGVTPATDLYLSEGTDGVPALRCDDTPSYVVPHRTAQYARATAPALAARFLRFASFE